MGLVLWVGCSYSNYTFESTNNILQNGYSWDMQDVLPNYNGLTVNGIYYQYTPIKEREDAFKVTVQNQNVDGADIFKRTDDWTGKSGGIQLRRVIGFEYIPREVWGLGSMTTDGDGTIEDANLVYTYRYVDKCATPLDNPTCDGYADAVLELLPEQTVIEVYDVLKDENIKDEEADVEYEEEKDQKDDKKEEERLERALAIDEGNLDIGEAIAQAQMLKFLNDAMNMQTYYDKRIYGGVYPEANVLVDKKLPDNKSSARWGLISDLRHNELINIQYQRRME